jgi:two-component system NarL family sensor kinase
MRRADPWRAWSACLLAVATLMVVFVLFIWHNDALPATNKISWVLGSIPSLAFVTMGAVVVARRPGNRIGWLCYGVGLSQILAGFGSQAAEAVLAADPNLGPVWLVVYELGGLCWELSWALLALLLLLFPTGQLPSPRWRPVAWAAGAVLVLAAFSHPFPALRPPTCRPTRSPSRR